MKHIWRRCWWNWDGNILAQLLSYMRPNIIILLLGTYTYYIHINLLLPRMTLFKKSLVKIGSCKSMYSMFSRDMLIYSGVTKITIRSEHFDIWWNNSNLWDKTNFTTNFTEILHLLLIFHNCYYWLLLCKISGHNMHNRREVGFFP